MNSILILYISLVLFVVISLWVIITNYKNILMFLYIPIIIVIIVCTIFVYHNIMGYPKKAELPEKFSILQYYVIPKKEIYLWIKIKDVDEPISYSIPYTEKMHKDLDKMQNAIKKGSARADQNRTKNKNVLENSRENNSMFYDFTETGIKSK